MGNDNLEGRGEDLPRHPAFVALSATVVSALVCDVVLLGLSIPFQSFRDPRTEFAFALPTSSISFDISIFVIAVLNASIKKFGLPLTLLVSFAALAYPVGGIVWSGPGYLLNAVMPLITCKTMVAYLGVAVAAILANRGYILGLGMERTSS